VVAWDPTYQDHITTPNEDQEDADQVWEGMHDVEDSDDEQSTKRDKKSRRTK